MRKEDLLISLITPYYNTKKKFKILANTLLPQLNNKIEWLVIDDGCKEKELDKYAEINVIHLEKNSGGASKPRNIGLDNAVGKYILFIDSDDNVSENYIETIVKKIEEEDFDYCFFSWRSQSFTVIIKDNPPNWNTSVWNCIYKKDLINTNRFNENLIIAEDYDFNIRVRKGKKANIREVLYYYDENTPNSLTKRGVKNG